MGRTAGIVVDGQECRYICYCAGLQVYSLAQGPSRFHCDGEVKSAGNIVEIRYKVFQNRVVKDNLM